MKKKKSKSKGELAAKTAAIAAVYVAITIIAAPASYGVMQVRVSEALTILPVFTPLAIPGLFIGCIIANFLSPAGIADVIAGSLATLIAASGTYVLRKRRAAAMLCPVVSNGIIVGSMLRFVAGINISLWASILWVSAGEALACYALGLPLGRILDRHRHIFR